MLIKEETIKPSLLDNIPYIDNQLLDESVIPVTENSRLGKYIISVEDISSFCENSEKDPGYVISKICESNNIPIDNIAFSVNEDSIILGESVANLSIDIANYGIPVYAAPTSHDLLWETIGYELAYQFGIPIDEMTIGGVKKMLGHSDDVGEFWNDNNRATQDDISRLVHRYSNTKGKIDSKGKQKLPHIYDGSDNNPIIQGQKLNIHNMNIDKSNETSYTHRGNFIRMAHKGTAVQRKRQREQEREDKAWELYNKENVRTSNVSPREKERQMRDMNLENDLRQNVGRMSAARQAKEEINDHYKEAEAANNKINSTVKQAEASNDKNFIAKVIAKLHDWAKRYSEKYKETKVSGPKSAIQKVLSYITRAISALTKRLHNLTTKYKID